MQNNLNKDLKNKALLFTVNGKEYKWNKQYITGKEIREIAGAGECSSESKLYLAIKRPWEDELIEDDTRVDLARPAIEHFYFKNTLLLVINGKEFIWTKEYITGAEIKSLAGLNQNDELFLSIRKPWDDEIILNSTVVNLARPGIENFYSKPAVYYSFYIDRKEFKTLEKSLTVRQILVDFGKVSAESNTLAEKTPNGFNELKNLDELLDLKKVRWFVIFNNNPTTVS